MKASRTFFHVVSSLVFAVALAAAVDVVMAFFSMHIAPPVFGGIFLITAALLIVFRISTKWLWMFYFVIIIAAGALLGAVLYGFQRNGAYSVQDNGKSELFGGHKVMVLVPHQDDEVLVAGGLIEEYLKYGSEVYLSFYTNGDYATAGETRLLEALAVADQLGVPRDHVIFLGYGDNLGTAGVHVYNMDAGQRIFTDVGRGETYGLAEHGPYRNSEYLRENIVRDLKDMTLELRPDIIFISDFEEHPDHAGLSLFYDEVMAEILSTEGNDYFPTLLRSPCYTTAFFGKEDFYSSENLLSTATPREDYFALLYYWNDRVRFPVHGEGLSHSLYGNDTHKQFMLHKSQWIRRQSECAINGDKVFWQRETTSLSYGADFKVSSGYAKYLSDFKLVDNKDVEYSPMAVSDCCWLPEKADSEKSIQVTLKEPGPIAYICLYDNPDISSNILDARISFDDGSSIKTGALNEKSITRIPVNKESVSSFSVEILSSEGDAPGLAELEFYAKDSDYGFDFIKFMDMDGNFVYDYFVDEKGSAEFTIFRSGVQGELRISCDNSHCSIKYDGETITVKCPKDQSCSITVSSEDGKYSDTAVISNPGRFLRETGPYFENLTRQFTKVNMQQSNSYLLLRTAYRFARAVIS